MGKISITRGSESGMNNIQNGSKLSEYSNTIMELVLMEKNGTDLCSSTDQPVDQLENMAVKNYQGSETVLLVDDQTALVSLLESLLLESGYRVFTAYDGQAAIDLFSAHRDEIDIIVMDIVMPRKDGVKAYYEISRINPDVKILFMSGFAADCLGELNTQQDIIVKPFLPSEMLKKIRKKLDENEPGSSS